MSTGIGGQGRLDGQAVPAIARELAEGGEPELVWHNELHGLTFRVPRGYLKWSPDAAGIDLDRERVRLEWLAARHPAPRVLDHGRDELGRWLLTAPVPGGHAVGEPWRSTRADEAVRAIAHGLRVLHAVPVHDVPDEFSATSWARRAPDALGPRPPIDDPVLVHGDACAPNTLLDADGRWTGHVDLGDLAVGDRWADLAVASMSLDWNFGEGHQPAFFAAYGVAPDPVRIAYYRALWDAES
jgi:kanamycin kinase